MTIYNIRHYIYSISQRSLFIIPTTKAMAKEVAWRTQKKVLAPSNLKLSLAPHSHYVQVNGAGKMWLSPECQMNWIKWWLGLSRYDGDRSSPSHPWALQLPLQKPSREAPTLSMGVSPHLQAKKKAKSCRWGGCSSPSPLSSSLLLSFPLTSLHLEVKCHQRHPSS